MNNNTKQATTRFVDARTRMISSESLALRIGHFKAVTNINDNTKKTIHIINNLNKHIQT